MENYANCAVNNHFFLLANNVEIQLSVYFFRNNPSLGRRKIY